MAPLAPGWVSTMKRWPSIAPSRSAVMRATTSEMPPGPYGTTILIVRDGQVCATARGAGIVNIASAPNKAKATALRHVLRIGIFAPVSLHPICKANCGPTYGRQHEGAVNGARVATVPFCAPRGWPVLHSWPAAFGCDAWFLVLRHAVSLASHAVAFPAAPRVLSLVSWRSVRALPVSSSSPEQAVAAFRHFGARGPRNSPSLARNSSLPSHRLRSCADHPARCCAQA